MKRFLALFISLSFLTGWFWQKDPIQTVKNSVIPQVSDSVTVGNLLNTYSDCQPETQTWKSYVSNRSETIVEFSCRLKSTHEMNVEFNRGFQALDPWFQLLLGQSIKSLTDFRQALDTLKNVYEKQNNTPLAKGLANPYLFELQEAINKLSCIDIDEMSLIVRFAMSIQNSSSFNFKFFGVSVKTKNQQSYEVQVPYQLMRECIYNNQSFFEENPNFVDLLSNSCMKQTK